MSSNMVDFPDIGPGEWLDAVAEAVRTLPYGTEILLVVVAGGVVRWAVVPLITAWRQHTK